jgi:hypothetical protein
MRPGGATRETRIILDGKGGEWTIFMFGARKVVAPTESIKDRSLGPGEQVRLCTGAYGVYGVPQT